MFACEFIVKDDIPGLEERSPPFGHGLPGIHIQIEEHLLDLAPVHFHSPRLFSYLQWMVISFFVRPNIWKSFR